jgi:hypothetical protein
MLSASTVNNPMTPTGLVVHLHQQINQASILRALFCIGPVLWQGNWWFGFAVVGKMSFSSTLKAFDRLMSLFCLVLICCFLLHKIIISNTTLVVFHDNVHEKLILKVLAFVELLHTCGKMFIFILKFLDLISKPFIVHCQLIVKVIALYGNLSSSSCISQISLQFLVV